MNFLINSPRKYKKGSVLCFPRDKLSYKSDKFLLTLIGFHLCKKFSFLCSFVSGVRGGAKHFCRANLSAMWFLQDTTGPKLAVVYCSTKNKTLQIFQQTAALRGSKPNSRFKEIFSFFFFLFFFCFFTRPFFTSQTRRALNKRLLSEQSLLLKIKGADLWHFCCVGQWAFRWEMNGHFLSSSLPVPVPLFMSHLIQNPWNNSLSSSGEILFVTAVKPQEGEFHTQTWGSFASKACHRGNLNTPGSHCSAKIWKFVENPEKMGIERVKEQTLGLSIPLLFQLTPLGTQRFLLQVVEVMFPAGKEVLEERMAASLTGEPEAFAGINGKNSERAINVSLAAALEREILLYAGPRRGVFQSFPEEKHGNPSGSVLIITCGRKVPHRGVLLVYFPFYHLLCQNHILQANVPNS